LIMVTSFTRITVVLSFLRQAMGANQMPPNQLLLGLSLILTFFIMAPAANRAYTEGIKPYTDKQITGRGVRSNGRPFPRIHAGADAGAGPRVVCRHRQAPRAEQSVRHPLHVLVPAFVISELRTAFQIAFVIFIPFLVIDMVVASVLMSMGMMMLPPVIVSLPFKILLFVLVDGWYLLVKSLVESFHV